MQTLGLEASQSLPGVILRVARQDGRVDVYVEGEPLPAIYLAPPSPAIPAVTHWQLDQALAELGLLDAVLTYVATAPTLVQQGWQHATEIARDDPLVLAAVAALGLSAADADALFLRAAAK